MRSELMVEPHLLEERMSNECKYMLYPLKLREQLERTELMRV